MDQYTVREVKKKCLKKSNHSKQYVAIYASSYAVVGEGVTDQNHFGEPKELIRNSFT